MKHKQILSLLTFIFGITIFTSWTVATDQIVYRLYHPHNGEHLYITDVNERNVLYFDHGWGFEGEGWVAPDSGTPVYRLYNTGLQNHLYTSDLNEINVLTSHHGWTKDNNGRPVFYSGGTTPIYRVYNRKLRGLHHWTTDRNEYNVLPRHGWQQEGIKFNAIQPGAQIRTHYTGNNDYSDLGNTDYIFLVAEEADARAHHALNDPSSGYSHYSDYEVMQATFPNGAIIYYIEFS